MKLKLAFSFSILSLFTAITTYADDTQAVDFAKQAGAIAGAAQACGQPITTLTMRAGEVITALQMDPTDGSYATAAYQRTLQDSYNTQVQSQKIACPMVISDYNNLPLLQPDYKQTVIAAISGGNTPAAKPQTSTPGTTPAPAATPSTAPQTAQATPPATNPLQAMTAPPAQQQYVSPNTPPAMAPSPAISQPSNTNNDMTRLQLAQQLTQMAQNVLAGQQNNNVANSPAQVPGSTGYPNPYNGSVPPIGQAAPTANPTFNPVTNPQLNEQLQGYGASAPMFNKDPGFQPYGSSTANH